MAWQVSAQQKTEENLVHAFIPWMVKFICLRFLINQSNLAILAGISPCWCGLWKQTGELPSVPPFSSLHNQVASQEIEHQGCLFNGIQTWISGEEVYSPNFPALKLKFIMCWRADFMSNLQIRAVLAGESSWKPLIQPPAWSRTNASTWSGQTWPEIPDLVDFIPALPTVLFFPIFLTQSVFLLFCLQEHPTAIMHHCAQRCTDTKWMWFVWKLLN